MEESLSKMNGRERVWTESIAACPIKSVRNLTGVGSRYFVEETKTRLGSGACGRAPRKADGVYELREPHGYYNTDSGPQKVALSSENARFRNVFLDKQES